MLTHHTLEVIHMPLDFPHLRRECIQALWPQRNRSHYCRVLLYSYVRDCRALEG